MWSHPSAAPDHLSSNTQMFPRERSNPINASLGNIIFLILKAILKQYEVVNLGRHRELPPFESPPGTFPWSLGCSPVPESGSNPGPSALSQRIGIEAAARTGSVGAPTTDMSTTPRAVFDGAKWHSRSRREARSAVSNIFRFPSQITQDQIKHLRRRPHDDTALRGRIHGSDPSRGDCLLRRR